MALDEGVVSGLLHCNKRWGWKQRLLVLYLNSKRRQKKRVSLRRKPRNYHRNRGYAVGEMDRLSSNLFKRMFRVDRSTFDEILELISPVMVERDKVKASNSSGTPISCKTCLAVTLRWLAGGSHIDLCFAWGIGYSTFYSDRGVIWPTIEALDSVFTIGLPFDDPNRLEELARGFYEHSDGILDGCILAMDGFAVRTRCPFESEVEFRKYRFRKGGFAIITLAGCDVDCRFIVATANHSGSTNDVIAWQDTDLYQAVEVEKRLPSKYFFIGDEAFTNTNQLLSPWPGRGLDRYKDSFNYWLSHS